MYVDSNGDGFHSAADVITAQGTSICDVWIRTDQNRDGSPALCPQAPVSQLDIFSYGFVLRAVGGTVSWGPFLNRFPDVAIVFTNRGDGSLWSFGMGGVVSHPAGLYRLASFTASVASGTPSIVFSADATPVDPGGITLFGTNCPGENYDGSYIMGRDWSDADGLAFSAGSAGNHAPVLAPPSDMAVLTGEAANQTLSASDADGQLIAFSKVSGPAFLDVSTTDPGSTSAYGRAHVLARLGDEGTHPAIIQATDGLATDQKSFQVTVARGPDHGPALALPPAVTLVAGTVGRIPVYASDSDGAALQLELASGPRYSSLSRVSSGVAATTAELTIAPTACDVGESETRIRASDGLLVASGVLLVKVLPPAAGEKVLRSYPAGGPVAAIVAGDWNGDGRLDVALGQDPATSISVYLGNGDGTLGGRTEYATGRGPTGVAATDLNRDGFLDLVVASYYDGTVTILRGAGDGTFARATDLPDREGATRPRTADLNRDGWPDLIVPHELSQVVSVYLNDRAGGFLLRADHDAGVPAYSVSVADFDRDGQDDLLVSNGFRGPGFVFLPGYGDGGFGDPRAIAVGGYIMEAHAADLNADGLTDVLGMSFAGDTMSLLGDGQGGFPVVTNLGWLRGPYDAALGDWNGDGYPDLSTADMWAFDTRILFGNGDGGFHTGLTLPVGSDGGAVAFADMNGDGWIDLLVGDRRKAKVWVVLNDGSPAPRARAFLEGPERVVPVGSSRGDVCVRYEPVDSTYANSDVDLTTLRLASERTGAVAEIAARPPRRVVEGDRDRDGISDLSACFSGADLARLFSLIQGRQTVVAQLEGGLRDGRRFCGAVEMDILRAGSAPQTLSARLAPNPLNPRAKLSFTTSQAGVLYVRVFDLNGRLVRTLLSQATAAPGRFDLDIDGKDGRGRDLASGVYFYRIEAAEGVLEGRFTILR